MGWARGWPVITAYTTAALASLDVAIGVGAEAFSAGPRVGDRANDNDILSVRSLGVLDLGAD
jgi:hypothetical protein